MRQAVVLTFLLSSLWLHAEGAPSAAIANVGLFQSQRINFAPRAAKTGILCAAKVL